MRLIFVLVVALSFVSQVASAEADVNGLIGVRNADFRAAPEKRSLWMNEVAGSVGTQYFKDWPVMFGARASFQQMRGNLGAGLSELSGFEVGPEVRGWLNYGALQPYARVAASWAAYQGTGSLSWARNDGRTTYLYGAGAVSATEKSYTNLGMQVGIGTKWQATQAIAALAEIDMGMGRMRADQEIFVHGDKLDAARDSNFTHRSFLIGAQADL